MPTTAAATLLVRPAPSALADAVHRGFLAAGFPVMILPTVYEAVAEAARSPVPIRHFIVGVDAFGDQEFRLFPLVRREWPGAMIVAYHSPDFAHKGRLAELVGADVVLDTAESVISFAESLAPAAPSAAAPLAEPPAEKVPAATASPEPASPAAAALPAETSADKPPAAAPAKSGAEALAALAAVVTQIFPAGPYVAASGPAAASTPPQTPAAGQPPAGTTGDTFVGGGEVVGTIELTEEELRLLLGEEEQT